MNDISERLDAPPPPALASAPREGGGSNVQAARAPKDNAVVDVLSGGGKIFEGGVDEALSRAAAAKVQR